MNIIAYVLSIAILLRFSAFFSGSETALFSISKVALSRLKHERRHGAAKLEHVLREPEQLLATILIGNLSVNTAASSILTLFILNICIQFGLNKTTLLSVGAILFTVLLLVCGEVLPKINAVKRSELSALNAAPIFYHLEKILYPVSYSLSVIAKVFVRKRKVLPFPTEGDLKTMVEIGREMGLFKDEEEEIIWNLVEMGERTAAEIMTPRIDLVCVDRNGSYQTAIELAQSSKRSRIPVYENSVDNICGILYVKDLILHAEDEGTVRNIMRPAYFVPESKRLSVLLEEFRKQGIHIAIVIDQFGGTAGLVTLEDVLEGIFGEIVDEYDLREEELPYSRVDEKTYLVDGAIDLKSLNRIFRRSFEETECERLSEFIYHQLGKVPKVGETLRYKKLEIEIKAIEKNRIEKVLIREKDR